MSKENGFEYNYSAKQQKEIEAIKKKYNLMPPESTENKMETLRRLDRSAERKGTVWGLVLGVVGTLVLGTGMSFVLVWTDTLMLQGILLGLVGVAFIVLAYPVYKGITKREREKLAPRILALTKELENEL